MTTKTIHRTLEKVASRVEETAPCRWRLGFDGGGAPEVEARLADDWLLLETVSPDGGDHRDPWELLLHNAELAGLAKLVLTPEEGRPRMQAEIPLDGPVRTARRLERVSAGFLGETGIAQPAEGTAGKVVLEEICDEAGWPCFERGEGRGAVTLETGNGFHQAVLEATTSGLDARVVLAELPTEASGWHPALAVLLLTGAAITRLVRPVARDRDSGAEAGFEVCFEERPTAAEVSQALSALSVACRLCAREAQALADPKVATTYLALRGLDRYRKPSRRPSAAGARKGV